MNKREDELSAHHLDQREYSRAAELLLDIAGPVPEQIRMNEREGKKYYTNLEPLTLRHMAAHLEGHHTYREVTQDLLTGMLWPESLLVHV